jgi:hypothetical protein
MSERVRRTDSFGDKDQRKCRFYAACDSLKDEWEDESGIQQYCEACGAAIFVRVEDML